MSGGAPAVGVFVSAAQASLLGTAQLTRIAVQIVPIDLAEPVRPSLLAQLAVAVVEVNPAEPRSVDRLATLARTNPQLALVAAIAAPDLALTRTLVREGIADVIALPIRPQELESVALEAQARRPAPVAQVPLAPLIGIVRTSGGCGATTLATHLAAELAGREWQRKGALLADLDLQFGTVGAYLDLPKSGSIADLVSAKERIDPHLIGSLAASTAYGLAVLSAQSGIDPIDAVPIDSIMAVSQELRRNFGVVVYDFPPSWTNWSASIAFSLDMLLLVIEPTLVSLRRARSSLDLFRALGIPDNRIQLVLNKAEARLFRPINTKAVSEAIGREPLASLPTEAEALRQAQDRGVLVTEIARRSPYATAIRNLADDLVPMLDQRSA